ncbi:hypothetical protein [Lysobacter brunescens]|uniref:Uncharacterized protein n=1 Tax=Lysobacter brunescens TaxID=262323 RepID=A0ABW2YDL1_9GAMM
MPAFALSVNLENSPGKRSTPGLHDGKLPGARFALARCAELLSIRVCSFGAVASEILGIFVDLDVDSAAFTAGINKLGVFFDVLEVHCFKFIGERWI